MAHYYQKKWVFTWNKDESGLLVDEKKLQNLLNEIVEEGVFQKERGEKTGRLHYQGRFKLKGPRTGKKQLLKLFSELACVRNLTFEPERSKDSTKYCSKVQTRIDGPWFVGTPRYRRNNTPITISQEQLLNELDSPLGETFRDRKVIWVQDEKGGAGKSTFIKWLRTAQRYFKFRALPQASVDRVASAVNIICKDTKLDVLAFDITREQGMDQYDQDLFAIVESIKNGYVVDVMYGRINEAIFKPPIVVIFSNKPFIMVKKYLSHDRWVVCQPTSEGLVISDKGAIHPGAITPINFKLLKNSSYHKVERD